MIDYTVDCKIGMVIFAATYIVSKCHLGRNAQSLPKETGSMLHAIRNVTVIYEEHSTALWFSLVLSFLATSFLILPTKVTCTFIPVHASLLESLPHI